MKSTCYWLSMKTVCFSHEWDVLLEKGEIFLCSSVHMWICEWTCVTRIASLFIPILLFVPYALRLLFPPFFSRSNIRSRKSTLYIIYATGSYWPRPGGNPRSFFLLNRKKRERDALNLTGSWKVSVKYMASSFAEKGSKASKKASY